MQKENKKLTLERIRFGIYIRSLMEREPEQLDKRGCLFSTANRGLSVISRFLWHVKIDPTTKCWNWQGYLNSKGYSRFFDGKTTTSAHRFIYEYCFGEIPNGFEIDHFHCRNRACCSPLHLEAVTPEENKRRARREFCRKGLHPLSGENLYINSQNARVCRACRSESQRLYHEKKKQMQSAN